MIPFCYIVYVLFVGLSAAVERQPEGVRSMISNARYVTILSWCTCKGPDALFARNPHFSLLVTRWC